jgi:hypothetical protein
MRIQGGWRIAGVLTAAVLSTAGRAAAPQVAERCAAASPCTVEAFAAQLVKLADEQDPRAVSGDFAAAFGVELARHTRVVVSTLLPTDSQNGVQRFVQLGDAWYPLSLGEAGDCVGLEPLDRLLKTDGWSAVRTTAPGPAVWTYRKWRREVSVSARPAAAQAGNPAACVQSIVLTYR